MSTAYLTLYRNLDLFPKNGYPLSCKESVLDSCARLIKDHQESVSAIVPRLDAVCGGRNSTCHWLSDRMRLWQRGSNQRAQRDY